MRVTIFLWCYGLFFGLGFCQLPNRTFMDRDSVESARAGTLAVGLKSMGFTKNNEYFNRIADGYTLYGIQLNPSLLYTLSDNFRLDAGIFIMQDFGNPVLRQILPTFTFRAEYLDAHILFGAIDGHLNHDLIEPLYDFEKTFTDKVEYGTQIMYSGPRLFFDAWVEWETMNYPGDPVQEELYVGLSLNRELYSRNNFSVRLPVQGLVYHKGGAIDASPDPLQTMTNSAVGIEMIKKNTTQFLSEWKGSFYYTYFKDFSRTRLLDYKDGEGWYYNVSARLGKDMHIMLSYWSGNEFYSMMGGKLYPSISSSFKKPYFVEPERKLIILRFFHDIHLTKGVTMSTRIEPFYDFQRKKIEFSHGFYLKFRLNEKLWQKQKLAE